MTLNQRKVTVASTLLRKRTLGKHINNLLSGVHVFDVKDFIMIDSIKQSIKTNFVGSGNVSHVEALAFNDHFDHRFVIFEKIKTYSHARNVRFRWNKIEIAKFSIVSKLVSWVIVVLVIAATLIELKNQRRQ